MRGHRYGGFIPRLEFYLVGAAALAVASCCYGGLSLDGGGRVLVQEGPAAAMAGDPVLGNLAINATPFGSSELGPELGLARITSSTT